MSVLLPIVSFVFNVLIFRKVSSEKIPWRECFLLSAVVWGVFVVISTEVLSLFFMLRSIDVTGVWIFSTICSILIFFTYPKNKIQFSFSQIAWTPFEYILVFSIGLIICILFLIAYLAPANNWDSLTYHMSRVMHWQQNQSISYYPTSIIRQLVMHPWSEYAICHFVILAKSDRWVNLIQWFAMLGSCLGVSLIAKLLGANRQGQIYASVIAITLPMGILQATSTQTDYVLTFWCVCFVCFLLLLRNQKKIVYLFGLAASAGLCGLTKGTGYVIFMPFIVWFFGYHFKGNPRYAFKSLLLVLMIMGILSSGYFVRNYKLNNNIFPNKLLPQLVVETLDPRALIITWVKNMSLHLGTPYLSVNRQVEKGVHWLHLQLGVDQLDKRINFDPKAFKFPDEPFHEDHAGNTLHFLLYSICFIFVFRKKEKGLRVYGVVVIISILLLSVFMKFLMWSSRLHLTFFILAAPLIAIVLFESNKKIGQSMMIIFLIACIPWLFMNKSRPIVGERSIFQNDRSHQYFYNHPDLEKYYEGAVDFVARTGCNDIGIIIGRDDWEYPLWVLLQKKLSYDFRLEHVLVSNPIHTMDMDYPLGDFLPCVIMKIDTRLKPALTYKNNRYINVRQFARLHVYLKTN